MQDRQHQLADRAAARQTDDEAEPTVEPIPVSDATRAAIDADNALSGLQAEAFRRGRRGR